MKENNNNMKKNVTFFHVFLVNLKKELCNIYAKHERNIQFEVDNIHLFVANISKNNLILFSVKI